MEAGSISRKLRPPGRGPEDDNILTFAKFGGAALVFHGDTILHTNTHTDRQTPLLELYLAMNLAKHVSDN